MILLLAILGCSSTLPELQCDGATVTGQVSVGPTDALVSSDLTVSGTATHALGLAIRSVTVGETAATATTQNFATWQAVLPIGGLIALADDADGDGVGELTLQAEATEVCGGNAGTAPIPFGEAFTLAVDLSPGVVVERLDLTLSPTDVVPANGNLVAVLELKANPEAAGAVVSLESSLGSFAGGVDRVTLGGDGDSDATAMVGFEADSSDVGTALIVASAEGILDSETVVIAGPPELTPTGAHLQPGEDQIVTVSAAGGLASCFAVSATAGAFRTDPDLLLHEQGPDSDGRLVFSVEADPEAMPDATLRVRCCDGFGQCTADDVGLFEVE